MQNTKISNSNKSDLLITLLMIVLIIGSIFIDLLLYVPLIYFFVELRLKKHSWNESGVKFKNAYKDLKDNWYLIILVGIVFQFLAVYIGKSLLPEYIEHVKSRIPLFNLENIIPLVILIIFGTLFEEIIFRAFLQERLSQNMKSVIAILISSIIFGVVHVEYGVISIVIFDISTIIFDSIIYGLIYERSKNILASWSAHLLADIVGLLLLVLV